MRRLVTDCRVVGRIKTYGKASGERFTFTGQDDGNDYEASRMGLLSFETWMYCSPQLLLSFILHVPRHNLILR